MFFCKVDIAEVFQNTEFLVHTVSVAMSKNNSYSVHIVNIADIPFGGNKISAPDTFPIELIVSQVIIIVCGMLQNGLICNINAGNS